MVEKEIIVDKKIGIGVVIQPMNTATLKLGIDGKTDLIMDRFPKDVQDGILAKQAGLAKGGKKKLRDTKEECREAIHMTSKGVIGFPVFGFKKGMMEATSFVGDKAFSKKLVSGAVKIMNVDEGLIPIKFKKQTVLEHRIGNNTKFSPCFHDWSCELQIRYDKNNISAQDIVTLLNYAGFYNGIGAWRPKGAGGGSGEYGMFEVASNGKAV